MFPSCTWQPKDEATSLHSHFLISFPFHPWMPLPNKPEKFWPIPQNQLLKTHMDFLSLHGWLAVTINGDYDPKAVPSDPARSDHLDSYELLRDHIPQPPCVICTHLRAETHPPPWLQRWAHPYYTCGWTCSSHTTALCPHACIFSHTKATCHTHCVNKNMKQIGTGQKGMQCATNTDLQPLPRPHLKHSRKASKEQTLCQIKYCVSSCSDPQTGCQMALAASGGTVLLQYPVLHCEPLVLKHDSRSNLNARLRITFNCATNRTT